MPSLGFQKQFVPGVRAMLDPDYARRNKIRPKTTTIRKMRKRPFKKGDRLFLFSGLRTPHCERLGETRCLKVEDFQIAFENEIPKGFYVDGKLLSDADSNAIAIDDGFKGWREMIEWFKKTHGLPFIGQRITMANTYDRKYYLHKRTKDLGINIQLDKCEKMIEITSDQVEKVKKSKHIAELQKRYSYGVQIINPIWKV